MTKARNLWLLALNDKQNQSSTRREQQDITVAGNGGHSLVAQPAVGMFVAGQS